MKKAKNNKGFSLVELIVVVLILGILAVAVSPQVMKWVGTSRINSDRDNANALKSAVSTALADWQGQGGKIDDTNDFSFVIKKDGTIADLNNWSNGTATKNLKEVIDEVTAEDYPEIQYEVYTGDGFNASDEVGYYVVIAAESGKVEVKCQATETTP